MNQIKRWQETGIVHIIFDLFYCRFSFRVVKLSMSKKRTKADLPVRIKGVLVRNGLGKITHSYQTGRKWTLNKSKIRAIYEDDKITHMRGIGAKSERLIGEWLYGTHFN